MNRGLRASVNRTFMVSSEGSATVHRSFASIIAMSHDDDYDEHEAMTPLAIAAATTHELYCALVEAGFSTGEAIRLVATIVVESSFE